MSESDFDTKHQPSNNHETKKPELTGEPISLSGRIDPRMMGSRVQREKPSQDLKKKVPQGQQISSQPQIFKADEIELEEELYYKPKTRENRIIYEQLLHKVYVLIDEQSQEVLKSMVDEILAIFKNEKINAEQKKNDIEALIGKIHIEHYSEMMQLAKGLTDYTAEPFQDQPIDEMRMNVDIEEEEESDQEVAQIHEENNNDQVEQSNIIQENQTVVNMQDITSNWLLNQLSDKIEGQPNKIEQDVLKILNSNTDIECENKLVSLLGYGNLQLIKKLLLNRHKIYYCTQLAKLQGDEKQKLLNLMQQSSEGLKILDAYLKLGQSQPQKQKQNAIPNDNFELDLDKAINTSQHEFESIPKRVIELEKIRFNEGAHLMANEHCKLPQGSVKIEKPGYDEIHIPAVSAGVIKEKLIKIEEIPSWAQKAFAGIDSLNRIQSSVYQAVFNNVFNMLVCAPTGAGKTNIALLAILQVIGNHLKSDGNLDLSKFKIVYIAPMKALVAEIVTNFQQRLDPFGIKVRELTGDIHLNKQQIRETQVIIATPEKWDVITRKRADKTFLDIVKLIIIDEIHLLHDDRGPVIEAIVSRTIRTIEQTKQLVRIVALSATLPNYLDVALFIRAKKGEGVFYFDNTYRPVPLEQQFIGINEKKPIKKMMLMNEILYTKVEERIGQSQILVFVHSRKETYKTAKFIHETAFSKDQLQKLLKEDSDSKKVIENILKLEDIKSQDLREVLQYGIGIHHAGMERSDRSIVEQLFADKHLQILVSTSTLAWGVNLPARTVIIKGTQIYSPSLGKWTELSPQDILQMMGRAGRPHYDTEGEGIIITSYQSLKFYLSLLNMQLPIESQFVSQLADQLNAEIVLGSIQNIKDAVNWLAYTYLYVRMIRNGPLYKIENQQNDPTLLKTRVDLVHSAAIILDKYGLVKYDRKTGELESTFLGKIASNYYLKYPSIQIYNEHLKGNMGIIDLFRVFSLSHEFKDIPIREEEKQELQRLMLTVPIPIKGSADDYTSKINILLQAFISRLKLDGFALNSDMIYVVQNASRIVRAIFEVALKREWAQLALLSLNLSKTVEKRMWGCMTPLRQFKGIPDEILRRVEKKEGITWDHLYQMTSSQIGDLIRYQSLGKTLHKMIHKFPKVDLITYVQPITRSALKIDLQITPDFNWDEKIHGKQEPFYIFLTDCDGEKILYCEHFLMKQKKALSDNKTHTFTFMVPLFEIMQPIYFIKVVSDRWLNCEAEQAISFKNLILPEPFLRPHELDDVPLLSISQLMNPYYERIIKQFQGSEFNQIISQVFPNIYQSCENFFLGAPSQQTKRACALLGMFQFFNTMQTGDKIIYIGPVFSIELFQNLLEDFLEQNGLKFTVLTGGAQVDAKLVEKSDVIFSSPKNFDILSRRWKTRKGFNKIKTFICDELHTIPDNQSLLEVIVSRIRMIQSIVQDYQIRIVGLSYPIANYNDIAEWIGVDEHMTFNFPATLRPQNLEIEIIPFEQNSRKLRVNQMQTHVYKQLKQKGNEKIIVIVQHRKQARLTALSFVQMLENDESHLKLVKNKSLLDKVIEKLDFDTYSKYCLQFGIAILYEGIDSKQREALVNLYNQNVIGMMVITQKMTDVDISASFVALIDNQKYDGLEKRYVDYTIPEIMNLLEYSQNSNGKCYFNVLVHHPKFEFYNKFIYEPIVVESHLNHYMTNHLNAETVSKGVRNTQDCIDWITWTFMYRRITQNPNYYNLSEVSGNAINSYLSELVENSIEELVSAKCVSQEEDNELEPINAGIIANYYYIDVQTVHNFSESISDKSRIRDLLFTLCQSTEFDFVPIRNGEETHLQILNSKIAYPCTQLKFNEPNTKVYIILQAYLSRIQLSPDMKYDLSLIIEIAVRLSTAMVDVASSNLFLKPAILCMQMCQMFVQAMWVNSDSTLKQIPYFNDNLVEQLKEMRVNDIADFMNMEDNDRDEVLKQFTQLQIEEIANACNRYPSIEIKNVRSEPAQSGDIVQVYVEIERQGDDYNEKVTTPFYSGDKTEQWWVSVADKKLNKLLSNKKVSIDKNLNVELRFQAPEAEQYDLTVYCICDSYVGADQVYEFKLTVLPK